MTDNLRNYGLNDGKRERIEAWFDEHPIPYEIDAHFFTIDYSQIKDVKVFFCDGLEDDFLIKIRCYNAQRAEYLSKLLYKTTSQMGIEQILIFKELFLLRRSKHLFEC